MKSNLFVIFLIFLTACSESIKPVDTAVENQILYIGNRLLHLRSQQRPFFRRESQTCVENDEIENTIGENKY